jgi:tRNA(Arg) A34 adenosine deaminase TadA
MISAGDRDKIAKAIEVARTSEHRFKVGAVISKSGRILASSVNRDRNNPKNVHFHNCSIHAEMGALRQVGKPDGSTVFVARVTRSSGLTAMARPCDRCFRELLKARVNRMVWTIDEHRIGETRIRELSYL